MAPAFYFINPRAWKEYEQLEKAYPKLYRALEEAFRPNLPESPEVVTGNPALMRQFAEACGRWPLLGEEFAAKGITTGSKAGAVSQSILSGGAGGGTAKWPSSAEDANAAFFASQSAAEAAIQSMDYHEMSPATQKMSSGLKTSALSGEVEKAAIRFRDGFLGQAILPRRWVSCWIHAITNQLSPPRRLDVIETVFEDVGTPVLVMLCDCEVYGSSNVLPINSPNIKECLTCRFEVRVPVVLDAQEVVEQQVPRKVLVAFLDLGGASAKAVEVTATKPELEEDLLAAASAPYVCEELVARFVSELQEMQKHPDPPLVVYSRIARASLPSNFPVAGASLTAGKKQRWSFFAPPGKLSGKGGEPFNVPGGDDFIWHFYDSVIGFIPEEEVAKRYPAALRALVEAILQWNLAQPILTPQEAENLQELLGLVDSMTWKVTPQGVLATASIDKGHLTWPLALGGLFEGTLRIPFVLRPRTLQELESSFREFVPGATVMTISPVLGLKRESSLAIEIGPAEVSGNVYVKVLGMDVHSWYVHETTDIALPAGLPHQLLPERSTLFGLQFLLPDVTRNVAIRDDLVVQEVVGVPGHGIYIVGRPFQPQPSPFPYGPFDFELFGLEIEGVETSPWGGVAEQAFQVQVETVDDALASRLASYYGSKLKLECPREPTFWQTFGPWTASVVVRRYSGLDLRVAVVLRKYSPSGTYVQVDAEDVADPNNRCVNGPVHIWEIGSTPSYDNLLVDGSIRVAAGARLSIVSQQTGIELLRPDGALDWWAFWTTLRVGVRAEEAVHECPSFAETLVGVSFGDIRVVSASPSDAPGLAAALAELKKQASPPLSLFPGVTMMGRDVKAAPVGENVALVDGGKLPK